MFSNYFKVAFRNLSKNKLYVLINTLGMGIAIACCLAAYLLIAFNLEFDDYFKDKNVEQIAKVIRHFKSSEGDDERTLYAPLALAPIASQEVAGIKSFTRYCNQQGIVSKGDHSFFEDIRFADSSFFDMFQLGLKSGSARNFDDQKNIFISEVLAKKYFADEDPIGKGLSIELNGKRYDTTVGGVLEKLALNTSFTIHILMRVENYLDANGTTSESWATNEQATVMFRLDNMDDRRTISDQLGRYTSLINQKHEDSHTLSFELIPFMAPVINGTVQGSNLRLPIPVIALVIFSLLGLLILFIACFNLTNTTMAMAGKRQKEIGIRKVVGSGRKLIVLQFLLEMVLTILLAVVAAVLMAQIIVPQFASMWQLQYGLSDLSGINFVLTLIILLFATSILAGIYPAISSSRFTPVQLMRGGQSVKGTTMLTRILLVLQFSLSAIVLIAGVVFTQNAVYQKELPLGYDHQNLLVVTIHGSEDFERLRNQVMGNPRILGVTGASNHIGPYSAHHKIIRPDTASISTNVYEVGAAYFEVVGLRTEMGRGFDGESRTDLESGMVIDQNFVSNHRLAEPIDTRVLYNDKTYRVVGVVNNHLSGLKQNDNSEHIYVLSDAANFNVAVIRTAASETLAMRQYLSDEWKKLFPGRPFQCMLQEEIVYEEANGYNNNLRQIFLFLTVLGSILSISGIYALCSLNVQKRTKEVGIRKVLGASVEQILRLLNKEFAIVLGIAGVLGAGGGYMLTSSLLDNLYVQHMKIDLMTVLMSGVVIFLVGIAATSHTIWRAATANPTEVMRSE